MNGAEEKTNGDLTKGMTPPAAAPADEEGAPKKLKYPRSIPFIIGNEFCERFNYYGMRTVLVLYLSNVLGYSDDTATVIFHVFTMMVYFLCIFGAILADSWLGKFKTILSLSIVYVVGSVVMSLGAIPTLNLPVEVMTVIGLLLIAIGSGGIKPCVSAFGGDQFKLPEQIKAMATFFSLFYFAINSGSLISTTVTPILRADVHCFGEERCFSLAFGVPAVLMATSVVIFIFGRPLYITKPPSGNMIVLVSKAIGNAISTRVKERKTNPKDHWLDYAEEKYGKQLVDDIKVLLRVLVLYIPLPVFWSLFDQQGSRWTFQATRMNGDFGSWDIKPDQIQMLNPLLILIFIPLYDFVLYPLLSKIGIRRPLQKLTIGGCLAGIAFLISAGVELQLEPTYPQLPVSGECQLRVINTLPNCDYTLKTSFESDGALIEALKMYDNKRVDIDGGSQSFNYELLSNQGGCNTLTGTFKLLNGKAVSHYIQADKVVEYEDNPAKSSSGNPLLRIVANVGDATGAAEITVEEDSSGTERLKTNTTDYKELHELSPSTYVAKYQGSKLGSFKITLGGVYTLVVFKDKDNSFKSELLTITEANSVNILWLIPQYVVMTLGEVMFSVTGLEFSYAQAPVSMKSVLQACWQLTVAFGNLIDVIIAASKIFNSQADEFFLFAGLMFVDMMIFTFLAYRYKPNNPNQKAEEEDVVSVHKIEGIVNSTFQGD